MGNKKLITPLYVGDTVTWSSQAGGRTKKKTGTVIEVVAANRVPTKMSSTARRKHESYIVEVSYEPKRSTSAIKSVRVKKPERYWPVVANLRMVKHGNWVQNTAAARPHPTGATDPAPAVQMQDYDNPPKDIAGNAESDPVVPPGMN